MKLFYQGCYEVRQGEMDEYETIVDSVAKCKEACYNKGFQYFTAKPKFLQWVGPHLIKFIQLFLPETD